MTDFKRIAFLVILGVIIFITFFAIVMNRVEAYENLAISLLIIFSMIFGTGLKKCGKRKEVIKEKLVPAFVGVGEKNQEENEDLEEKKARVPSEFAQEEKRFRENFGSQKQINQGGKMEEQTTEIQENVEEKKEEKDEENTGNEEKDEEFREEKKEETSENEQKETFG